jgi:septal ring factor EnvC (AmiA/AmiB activator)
MHRLRRTSLGATLGAIPLLVAALAAGPVFAQSRKAPDPELLRQRDRELQSLRTEQRRTIENESKLRREIEALGEDRRKFNEQLIETANRVREIETRIGKTQDRLAPLDASEKALRKSLDSQQGVMIEVLAALQRMGRHPPPALMVRPEDALQSVRTAMMLGAVLPDMRQQAQVLIADLTELVRLRKAIADERDVLMKDLAGLEDDRERLALMVDERQKKQAATEQAIDSGRRHTQELARQAEDVKGLIAKLEESLDPAARSARAAARAQAEREALASRPDLAALRDPGRLAPAVAFASAKARLPLPVNGVRIKDFGVPDGTGGTERGLSFAARANAQVTSPCDGWVVYSGPFRNYGQLLILNAGGGYHVLLAGMSRISVDLGQFVLTGEPVAVMGSEGAQGPSAATGSSQPVLYVEFRKDGSPVDPSPWWAASEGEKVRG